MTRTPSRFGLAFASLSAGPIFLTSNALAGLYLELPRPLNLAPIEVVQFTLMCIPAVFVGTLLSFVPLVLGTAVMSSLGRLAEPARSAAAWILAGALMGAGIAALFGTFAVPQYAFSLIATSAACAAMCHRWR